MPDQTPDEKQRLEIDWVKIVAGALAAVSSAVILSTLGVAGTIIGAAVGSLVVSLSSSLYGASISRSRERARAQVDALRRVGVAQAEVRRASRRRTSQTAVEGHLGHADEELGAAQVELDEVAASADRPVPWRQRLVALPWKRIGLLTAVLFVIAIVAITVFELIAGRPVSDLTGGSHHGTGTSLIDLGGGGGKQKPTPPAKKPAPGPSHTSSPTGTPTVGSSPSESPPTQLPPVATPSETPSPTGLPSSEPSTPAPSETTSPTAGATG